MRSIAKMWFRLGRAVPDLLADRRGMAAVEFAFILPVMMVMLFGTVEFSSGIAVWDTNHNDRGTERIRVIGNTIIKATTWDLAPSDVPRQGEPPQIEYPRRTLAWLNEVLAQVEANRRLRARRVAAHERDEFPRLNELWSRNGY